MKYFGKIIQYSIFWMFDMIDNITKKEEYFLF